MTDLSCAVCATPVTRTGKHRAYSCGDCGKTLCGAHVDEYIDSANCAITRNGPTYCHDCYVARYGARAPWPVNS